MYLFLLWRAAQTGCVRTLNLFTLDKRCMAFLSKNFIPGFFQSFRLRYVLVPTEALFLGVFFFRAIISVVAIE
jgi:hypothetical protein